MIQNMLLKEKENLGFYINQFTEAIFISSLQIIIFFARKYVYLALLFEGHLHGVCNSSC